ncbi:terminase gpA endonuclease subunit [Escherichia coli]
MFYLCEHNACVIRQQELDFTDARYICEKTGIWTRDGILWFSSSGEEIEPPDSVTFHIWTAYSPFTTWVQIVKDWMKTKGDTGKRKTFVNTTLGETWEAKIGERPDAEVMAERKEHYSAPVPDGPRQARSYQVMNGIAVLPVSGTLVSRTRALQPYSGMTGYNGIIARLQQAASDPMVDGILLDMDTPGGMVAGAFDCADIIARVRDIKPVWALANDMNCSAGQLLASAASRRLVTQTARTGSIGVMMAHSNYGAALEKQGVEITLIYSGSHKVDGNPYSHLPDDVRETLQSRMDATRRMFAQKVSAYTGLSVQAVLDTEAAVYSGQEAIDAGLADELVNSTDAITVMRDALDARKSRLSGGRMTKETQSTTVSATASQADVTDVVPATEGENASAAQPDVNAQITAAVAAENSRIMGILNCEEAHGREEQARVLAETPGMTVETARRILAAAPQSAQARSDTALDRLMQGAPAPLAAGNPASDAVNDLLNTPV